MHWSPTLVSVLFDFQKVPMSEVTADGELQSFQWIKCLSGDLHSLNLVTQESYSTTKHFQSAVYFDWFWWTVHLLPSYSCSDPTAEKQTNKQKYPGHWIFPFTHLFIWWSLEIIFPEMQEQKTSSFLPDPTNIFRCWKLFIQTIPPQKLLQKHNVILQKHAWELSQASCSVSF